MRLVPDLDERLKTLERRQRDRRAYINEQEELYARKQREIENLKGIRDSIARGEEQLASGDGGTSLDEAEVRMGGVRFGSMEIFVSCKESRCHAQATVWAGDPDAYEARDEPMPAGWTMRDGETYCPRHSHAQ
jgi:hypothetical protein